MLDYLRKHGIEYKENVPMSAKTTFKIGGPAALIMLPATKEQVVDCVHACTVNEAETSFILGNGSNLLVKDSGLHQPVISTEKLQKIHLEGEGIRSGAPLLRCGAGDKLSEVCVFAQKKGLMGLEFAYGIPGSAGGATFMNAGAYGGEMKDVLHEIEFVNSAGEFRIISAEEAALGYRHSIFAACGGIITGITLRLTPGDPLEIKKKMQETLQKRRDKQPLEYPSAGSVFKRPEGYYAGELIQRCGLKGKRVGGAQVSEKHAGFIVNAGNAKAADVRALIALIQTVVEQETGVLLIPEIKFV